MKKIFGCFLTITCAITLLSGCGSTNTAKENKTSEHEAITINAPYNNISDFVDLVHKKYPEINIDVIPYSGKNTTTWMNSMLQSGDLPDIYFRTVYSAANEDVSDKLMDLSSCDFTDSYVQSRLREVTDDGA